jgi:hypothetical protein
MCDKDPYLKEREIYVLSQEEKDDLEAEEIAQEIYERSVFMEEE